jgi:peptide/nickel transport system substrate-binding protein
MKKSLLILLVLLFVLGFSFNSYAAPTGTIRVANPDFSYEATDPVDYESFWGWSMYDSLLAFNEKGAIVPFVAEKFSLSPEGVWTFKIRKGIKFHNGDPLTAADVKFSVDRFGDMSLSKNPWSMYISKGYNKKDSRVVDDYTFEFTSAHPEPAQAIAFAWTRILPKKYFESVGQDAFRKKPVGSGPWKFVEHVPKTRFRMEANTEYWGQVPAFQYVLELMVPEQATRIAMLKAGDVDIALGIDYDRIADLKKSGYRTERLGFPLLSNISFQGTWLPKAGPTGDIRVRQAMSYALNREEIAKTWYQGFAQPGGQFYMHRGCYGWSDALLPDPYDLPKAKALLAEAGYPGKFADPTIHIYTTAAGQDYMLVLMNYWKAAGLQVKLEILDAAVWGGYFFSFKRLTGNEPNVGWIFPWTFASYFNSAYHCANMYTSIGVHNTGNDRKADELYKKATTELDPVKAEKYWNEFQVYVRTLYINIGIIEGEPLIVVGPTLGKFTGRNWVSLNDAYNGIQHP